LQRAARRREQLRRPAARDQVRGVQREQMGNVPMDHVALDEILRPFLQLPALADLEGQQAVELTLQPGPEFGVAIEQLRRADGCAEQVAYYAQVHGGSHANARRSLRAGLASVLEFDL